MTDVNIATNMLIDAYQETFDVAMLISGDSDLVPPIRAIRDLFPAKEVWAVFPPSRSSNELKKACNGSFSLGRAKLENSQLPDNLTSKFGFALRRPKEWTK